MKRGLCSIGLFLLAAGTRAMAQTRSADPLAPNDLSHAGAMMRPAGWGARCVDSRVLCFPNARSPTAPGGPPGRANWRVLPLDGGRKFGQPLSFQPSRGFPGSSTFLGSARMAARLPAYSRSKASPGVTYTPPTGGDRTRWALKSSFGWRSLGVGVFDSAWGTARNSPKEWHGTWEGFGKRLGTRQASVTISNSLEAAVGAIWGEDPRYLRSDRQGFWRRTGYALKTTLLARDRSGKLKPAYARYVGMVGNNFVSNAWRPPSENNWDDALARSGWGILARMSDNLFDEFWRSIRISKKPSSGPKTGPGSNR